jgi:hypothetical protein
MVVAAVGTVGMLFAAHSPTYSVAEQIALPPGTLPQDLDAVIERQRLKAPAGDPTWRRPPTAISAAEAGDVAGVIFNWRWYTGMLRGNQEIESVATLEVRKSTGTIHVDGQPCALQNYRASINYQVWGMRAEYTCTLPNGQSRRGIEVVSAQKADGIYAWDEDVVGAGLTAGRGTATPRPEALHERLIRLWVGPQGAVKAAHMGGTATKVALERGKPVITFPIPGLEGAIAKATLNGENQAERVEVRHGNTLTELLYEKYDDYNPADDKVDGLLPGHIVEKRNGATVLDLNIVETHVGNMYVVMPVPASVRRR